MTDTVKAFILLVDEKEAAREANKSYYVDIFTMSREMMIALRDELKAFQADDLLVKAKLFIDDYWKGREVTSQLFEETMVAFVQSLASGGGEG